MKKWTLDEWKGFVMKNCSDSYSLVICLACLLLQEAPDEDKKDPEKMNERLKGLGLSGFQAEMALSFFKEVEIQGLPGANGANPLLAEMK